MTSVVDEASLHIYVRKMAVSMATRRGVLTVAEDLANEAIASVLERCSVARRAAPRSKSTTRVS